MAGPILPVEGRFFEETIDGYFPLVESLRQMLVRQGLAGAWVEIAHAPIIHLPGLAPDAPVPLRIDGSRAGMLRRMGGLVRLAPEGATLGGQGLWRWLAEGPADRLPADIRLAEPAFLRGIGLSPGKEDSGWLGRLRGGGPEARFGLCPADALDQVRRDPGWSGAVLWGPCAATGGIVAERAGSLARAAPLGAVAPGIWPGGACVLLVRGAGPDEMAISEAMRRGL